MFKSLNYSIIIFIVQLVVFCSSASAAQLALPTGDIIAPVIVHEPLLDSIKLGTPQVIKAIATDNIGIKSVVLFYRTLGSENYKRLPMNKVGVSNEYAATLGLEDTQGQGIEYYIQAIDLAGNALLHGYSFAPLTVAISSGEMKTESAENKDESETTAVTPTMSAKAVDESTFSWISTSNKWLWIGIGVVVTAAALSGGGSDDGGGGDTTETGVVSFDSNVPQ